MHFSRNIGRFARTLKALALRGSKSRYVGGSVSLRRLNDASDYAKYVSHQTSKTRDPQRVAKWTGEEWEPKLNGFRELFGRYAEDLRAEMSALCIGARTGQEVVALKELGLDAIGIDLVAFPPHVREGDMHELPFPDQSFDFVFCNVLDHSPQPEKAIGEIERVCRAGGISLVFLQVGILVDEFSENVIFDGSKVAELFKRSKILEARRDSTTFDGMNFSIRAQKNA